MAVRSKTTIFNAALLRCGRASDGGDSSVREAMEANYDEIVRAAFEDGDGAYPFGRARETLTSRSAGEMGYNDAYTLPTEAIHVMEVYLDGYSCAQTLEPWDIYAADEAQVLVNADGRTVEVDYVKQGLEHTWSASFALGVQRALEAVIKDFLEESEEAAAKLQEADMQFLKAGVKAGKNRSRRRIRNKNGGRLLRARRGEF